MSCRMPGAVSHPWYLLGSSTHGLSHTEVCSQSIADFCLTIVTVLWSLKKIYLVFLFALKIISIECYMYSSYVG